MATIRKLPNGRFRADIRKNYTFIQAKTFSSKKEAEQWASDFDAKLDQILSLSPSEFSNLTPDQVEKFGGRDVFSKLGIELEFLTFHELVDEYVSKWNKKDENQIPRAYYWQEYFQDKPIKAITSTDVRKALDHYAKGKILKGHGVGKSIEINKHRSNNSVIRRKAVLSSIFKYAIQRGYLKENPVEGVVVESTPNEVERFLDDKERENLLLACKKSTWNKMHLMVMMAITTGMRKSEIMNLRWSDIDFDKGLAKLATSKNGSRRLNPIPAFTLEELKEFQERGSNLIFPSPTDTSKPFNCCCRAKIDQPYRLKFD